MMMIKFTNNLDGYKGDPLYLNRDWIAAVYEKDTDGGSLRTIIWGGPTGQAWEVEESLNEVIKKIEAS